MNLLFFSYSALSLCHTVKNIVSFVTHASCLLLLVFLGPTITKTGRSFDSPCVSLEKNDSDKRPLAVKNSSSGNLPTTKLLKKYNTF